MREDTQRQDATTPLTSQQQGVTAEPTPDDNPPAMLEPSKVEVKKSSSRRSRGPHNPRRSKYNALKHGPYSKKLLLKGESRADFESFCNGLWDDLRPRGTLAIEIFGAIFWNRWNMRRLFRANHAVLTERVELLEYDRQIDQQAHAWNAERWGNNLNGMLKPGSNPFVLRKCLEILQHIRRSVETNGFEVESDLLLLEKLYGTHPDGEPPPLGILFFYFVQKATCLALAGEKEKEKTAGLDNAKKQMLEALDDEIGSLTQLVDCVVQVERVRSEQRVAQACVLNREALDCTIRLETHLTREFARYLGLLEQANRMYREQQLSIRSNSTSTHDIE